jgi:hypothetical protein
VVLVVDQEAAHRAEKHLVLPVEAQVQLDKVITAAAPPSIWAVPVVVLEELAQQKLLAAVAVQEQVTQLTALLLPPAVTSAERQGLEIQVMAVVAAEVTVQADSLEVLV